MSKISKAVGKPVPGPAAKTTTGAGVISSGAWSEETLPMGTFTHIGLEETADTIGAGQVNQQTGIETS